MPLASAPESCQLAAGVSSLPKADAAVAVWLYAKGLAVCSEHDGAVADFDVSGLVH